MTIKELIAELQQHDAEKTVTVWDFSVMVSTEEVTITEMADGSILIW